MPDDPWLWVAVAAVPIAILVQACFSRLETALISARRSRVHQLASGDPGRLAAAEALLVSPERFDTASHVTSTLCEAVTYSATALIALAIAMRGGEPASLGELVGRAAPWILLALLVAVLAVLLVAEALPKMLATRAPEAIVLRNARFMRRYGALLSPLVMFIGWTGRGVGGFFHIQPDIGARAARTEEEIKIIVGGSAEEGVIEEEEKEMIHSIFDFTESVARQIMVPRIQIQGIEAGATLEEAARLILEHGHTRIPVYEDTIDQVVGILHAKDLLRELLEDRRETPISPLLREPFFVPESKKLDELLAEFRQHRTQLAIVVDEFGGTAGLVTIEDVLEEIVGEIQDEYDAEEPAIQVVDPRTSVVDAHMTIDDVNEELGLELPAGDYETLGGLVYELFGRPPEVGEQVAFDSVSFVVEAAEGPRLLKVRISRAAPPPPPELEGGADHPSAPG